jgi:hypothetical protein
MEDRPRCVRDRDRSLFAGSADQAIFSAASAVEAGFGVRRSGFGVRGLEGAVKTSVALLVQDIGNTVTVLVSAIWQRGVVPAFFVCVAFLLVNSWLKMLRFLLLAGMLFCPAHPRRATNRRPDLSIIAPGRCAARMPGTGPLRRSSGPDRKKAIMGKSRVAPDRLQWPAFVFLALARIGFTFSDLHGKSLTH